MNDDSRIMGGSSGNSRIDTTLGLLEQARHGDESAMDRLYRKVLPAVRQWARGQVPRESRGALDTDDLVQETLMRTLSHMTRLESSKDRGFYMYLREALRNRIRDELRRVRRRPETGGEDLGRIPEAAPGPLQQVIGKQSFERYEEALARLEPGDRAMVVARIEFGLGWSEIAEVSGKPSEDAARMTVSRALARIASELGNVE